MCEYTQPPAHSPTVPHSPSPSPDSHTLSIAAGFECIPCSTCATRSHQRQRQRHHIRISIQQQQHASHTCSTCSSPPSPYPSLLLVLFFRACPYSTSSLFATFRIQNISDKLASLSATCDKMQCKQRAAKAAPSANPSPLAPPSLASIPPQAGWTMQRHTTHVQQVPFFNLCQNVARATLTTSFGSTQRRGI